jgi:ABC-type antimicrobial peptide transport system permease subunit
MGLVLVGISVGLAGAFGLTRFLSSQLFGVGSADPSTFGAITLLLSLTAFLACYIPARRATRVDPVEALHAE